MTSTDERPDNNRALKDQARAIRLSAQKLETLSGVSTDLFEDVWGRALIQRNLGEIRSNLDALFARFGKGDR